VLCSWGPLSDEFCCGVCSPLFLFVLACAPRDLQLFRHVPMSPSVVRRVHQTQIHAAHQTHSPRAHPRYDTKHTLHAHTLIRYEERAEARKNLRAARRAVRSPPSTAAEKKAARKEREAAAVQDKAAQEADRKKRREQRRLQAEKAAQEIAEEEAYIIEATKVRAISYTCPEWIAERMSRDAYALLLTPSARSRRRGCNHAL
jgi:hypothetical protein